MVGVAGDFHPLELGAEPHIDIDLPGVFVEVQERTRSAREGTAFALPKLREPAQLSQQCLDLVEVGVGCVPHVMSMTLAASGGQGDSADDCLGLTTENLSDGLIGGHLRRVEPKPDRRCRSEFPV